MSLWHVTNHKLYRGANPYDTSEQIFLVGTEFGFGISGASYYYENDWTNDAQKADRTNAGNAVLMWGEFLGHQTASTGASNLLSCIRINSNIDYFIPNIDLFNTRTGDTGWFPRGQHSYITNQTTYVDKGHWKKLPLSAYLENDAGSDLSYITQWSNNSSYWNQNTNLDGTELWHNAWISNVINGNAGGTNFYSKLAAWYLMDEAFNPDWYRDSASNQFSVSGHSSFCSAQEPADAYRPKMTGPGAMSGANAYYTAMSGAIDILCGNEYWAGNTNKLWCTPNMVAWMYSKISNETRKMIIPWLWGLYENINYSKYVFYGSLIKGARGILWWRRDATNSAHYSVYAHQSNIYNMFTASASFSNNNYPSDKTIFLSGTDISSQITEQTTNTFADSAFPVALSNKVSIKTLSYGGKWRIYVVNHTSSNNLTFTAHIASTPPALTAYKRGSVNYVQIYDGGSYHEFTDTLQAKECQFYNIG